jgi:hypothetical protein
MNLEAEPPLAIPLTILFPVTPACPGTQYNPTACWVEIYKAGSKYDISVAMISMLLIYLFIYLFIYLS